MRTQVKALFKQIESGKYKSDRARLLNYFRGGTTAHYRQVMMFFGWRYNTTTSCVAYLLDFGLIKPLREVEVEGYKCHVYGYVENPLERQMLEKQRRIEKFKLWKKRGERDFKDLILEEQLQLKF